MLFSLYFRYVIIIPIFVSFFSFSFVQGLCVSKSARWLVLHALLQFLPSASIPYKCHSRKRGMKAKRLVSIRIFLYYYYLSPRFDVGRLRHLVVVSFFKIINGSNCVCVMAQCTHIRGVSLSLTLRRWREKSRWEKLR